MQSIINICFASDDNYAPYMGMAIFSILRNANLHDNFHFYVLDNRISSTNKQKIEYLRKLHAFQITWLALDTSLFKQCDTKHPNWTLSIFGRYGRKRSSDRDNANLKIIWPVQNLTSTRG